MEIAIKKAGLEKIAEKVFSGTRLTPSEGVELYKCRDLHALGQLANHVRERKNGNVATYIFNYYLNYSNVCILSCQFCAFAKKLNQEGAFEYTLEDMVTEAKAAKERGATEVHMVGGLHPKFPFSYYTELVSALSATGIKVKAFTAIEIRHIAERIAKKPINEVLEELKSRGLYSLTGGGAEIFDPEVRDKICRGKETAEEWIEVHRMWHQMDMRSTCTMLYGHIETYDQRIDHLTRLRNLQNETGGFTGFVPFAFQPEETKLSHIKRASGFEDLRNLAVARIYLDNFDHITAYWISLGLPLAQVSLSYGVDDLHGTIGQEKIFHMAGAKTPQTQTVTILENAIREAGREPLQRDTYYKTISRNKPLQQNYNAVATV